MKGGYEVMVSEGRAGSLPAVKPLRSPFPEHGAEIAMPSFTERWTPQEQQLWQEADAPTRRRALQHRRRVRAALQPELVPRPECPVAWMLHRYELEYRRNSATRGVVEDV